MGSKPFHAVAAAAAAASAVFMLVMAYQSGFWPGYFFGDAAVLGVPMWVVVAVLSISLLWLSGAHLSALIRGQTPASHPGASRAG